MVRSPAARAHPPPHARRPARARSSRSTPADFMRFLFAWQHVAPGDARCRGPAALAARARAAPGLRSAGRRLGSARSCRRASSVTTALARRALPRRASWRGARLAPREAAMAPSRGGADRDRAPARPATGCWCRRRDDDPDADGGFRRRRATCCGFLQATPARASSTTSSQGAHRLRSRGRGRALGARRRGPRHGRRLRRAARADLLPTQSRGGARARWHARWGRRGGAPAGAGRWALLRSAAARRPESKTIVVEALARQYSSATAWCSATCSRRETRAPLVARSAARLPPAGDARRAARRSLRRRLRRRAIRAPDALESLRAIRARSAARRAGAHLRVRSAEPGRHRHPGRASRRRSNRCC